MWSRAQCHLFYGFFYNCICTDILECASDPCLNGGSCFDGTDAFACICIQGFTGKRCEIGKQTATNGTYFYELNNRQKRNKYIKFVFTLTPICIKLCIHSTFQSSVKK